MEKVMSEGSSAKEISLGDGFGEVAVKANGIRIELHAEDSATAARATKTGTTSCRSCASGDELSSELVNNNAGEGKAVTTFRNQRIAGEGIPADTNKRKGGYHGLA
jgi:hypothetical protein